VAAEALINGIPPLVSDRGALPQTVRGAGRVLPLPSWLTEKTRELPTVEEAKPWCDAICELWDDEPAYSQASEYARVMADRWYNERIMRQRYLEYFGSLGRGRPLFDEV
jgi:glycosyltransferase involved in cell wall biosynthesis